MKTGFKLPACILALLSCLAAPAQEKCGIIGYVHEFIEVFGEEQSVAVGGTPSASCRTTATSSSGTSTPAR